jgi:hypothetical protein
MHQLRFNKPQRRVADPRIIQYALNPPCSSIPATHYATVCCDTMRYLLLNGDWFVFTFGWQYIQHVPHCTPVGGIEVPREQVATVVPVVESKHVPMDIYSSSKYKGD